MAAQRRSIAPSILVVDDDDLVREVVVAVLRGTGHEVAAARNGAEAIERVASAAEPFHLVLLDVQMPVMDGWSTIRELRSRGCATPVVMMSGQATEAEAVGHGAVALLAKPFDHYRLVETVSRWAQPEQDIAAG